MRALPAEVRPADRRRHGSDVGNGRAQAFSGAVREDIATFLEHAVESLDATGAKSLAECGRFWLGEIVGGARGGELRARALRWLVEQGVQDPARMAYSILPGFRTRPLPAEAK